MWAYLLSVSSGFSVMFCALFFTLLIMLVIYCILSFIHASADDNEEKFFESKNFSLITKLFYITVICGILSCLLPSGDSLAKQHQNIKVMCE